MITSSALWVGPYNHHVVTGTLDEYGYIASLGAAAVETTADDALAMALQLERAGYRLVSASGSRVPLADSPTRPSTPMAIKLAQLEKT